MSGGRSGKMVNYINYRMRVTLSDTRMLVGKFLAFDKHMNLVLADTEEFRRISGKGKGSDDREEKRALDLVLIRGENVVSLSVEGPPPLAESRTVSAAAAGGVGRGAPAGRGVPAASRGAAAPGLAGPVAGVGGAGPGQMMVSCCHHDPSRA
jgi:small nuclear ribonucleoprotein B and B'